MKHLLLIALALLFIGCEGAPTPHYDKFVDTYGSNSRFYCDESGFLIEERAYSIPDHISRDVVRNDSYTPVRCNVEDISIQVKETVATGTLSGNVQ